MVMSAKISYFMLVLIPVIPDEDLTCCGVLLWIEGAMCTGEIVVLEARINPVCTGGCCCGCGWLWCEVVVLCEVVVVLVGAGEIVMQEMIRIRINPVCTDVCCGCVIGVK